MRIDQVDKFFFFFHRCQQDTLKNESKVAKDYYRRTAWRNKNPPQRPLLGCGAVPVPQWDTTNTITGSAGTLPECFEHQGLALILFWLIVEVEQVVQHL
jgi:hypothetical protein